MARITNSVNCITLVAMRRLCVCVLSFNFLKITHDNIFYLSRSSLIYFSSAMYWNTYEKSEYLELKVQRCWATGVVPCGQLSPGLSSVQAGNTSTTTSLSVDFCSRFCSSQAFPHHILEEDAQEVKEHKCPLLRLLKATQLYVSTYMCAFPLFQRNQTVHNCILQKRNISKGSSVIDYDVV